MSGNNTVTVSDISSTTSEQEVKDFFAFCGKISDIKITSQGEHKTAQVTFAQATAARTALMLNNTQLGPNQIKVSGAEVKESESSHGSDAPKLQTRETDELTQEEKPLSRIFAEYLAHGYIIGERALEKAIEVDHKQGISSRFQQTLVDLDTKYHAAERVKAADKTYSLTERANSLLVGINSYFDKATSTPTGRKLRDLYVNGYKQVKDIHDEARRLAELKKQEQGGDAAKTTGQTGAHSSAGTTSHTAAHSTTGTTATSGASSSTSATGASTGGFQSTGAPQTGSHPAGTGFSAGTNPTSQ